MGLVALQRGVRSGGFSSGSAGEDPPANAGDLRDVHWIFPWGRYPEEGNGNPLQYPCLENPMDRGAWQATVHGVTKSHVRLLATPWTAAHQAPPPLGFSRQEDWSGCHCLLQSGTSGKEPSCQCKRHKRHGFNSCLGKILWRRKWQPTPVFLPGEPHGQRSLAEYPWGCKESDTTEQQQNGSESTFFRTVFRKGLR